MDRLGVVSTAVAILMPLSAAWAQTADVPERRPCVTWNSPAGCDSIPVEPTAMWSLGPAPKGAPVTIHVPIQSENSAPAPVATVMVGRAPIAEIGGRGEDSQDEDPSKLPAK